MLEKKHRLTKRKEFNYIFKHGKSFASKHLILNYLPTKLPNFKIGFSVSKKIGNAVVRNKIKRQTREAFKTYKNQINNNFNYIFVARKGIENLNYNEILDEVNYCLKKTKLKSDINE